MEHSKDRFILKHDNDDDGEDGAGSRLAQLLQSRNEQNVLVVVSRWFGGIQLGPKRFAHITNVARDLLVTWHEEHQQPDWNQPPTI
jgi:putative IMPACT (imprinted ancient) family translation regulator